MCIRDSSGTVKTAYTSGATTKYTSEDIKGTWTDLAFGGRYGFNANNSIFADLSTGLSGDYKAGWSVNCLLYTSRGYFHEI